ncbi:MAG: DUF3418 domain-containing protein, partial [Bifidobacteriaceae bacterium]|nr:DUF3418 domain-containing protein [Bifidobacteriaceae bacterium]
RPLTEVLAAIFRETRGLHIPPEAWNPSALPDHLKLTFQVEDPQGRPMAAGPDLARVVATATAEADRALARIAAATAARSTTVTGQPASPTKAGLANSVSAQPDDQSAPPLGQSTAAAAGLQPTTAAIRAADQAKTELARPVLAQPGVQSAPPQGASRDDSAPAGRQGDGLLDPGGGSLAIAVRERLLGELALPSSRLTSRLRPEQALPLAASRYPSVAELTLDVQRAVIQEALDRGGIPADQAAYDRLKAELRDNLEDAAYGALRTASDIIAKANQIDAAASRVTELPVLNSVVDIKDHLARLLGAGFLSRAGLRRFKDLSRYLATEAYRLERLGANRAREDQALWELAELDRALRAAPDVPAELPWMVEEFRVSLFAQQLGTAYPISAKRIRRALAAR